MAAACLQAESIRHRLERKAAVDDRSDRGRFQRPNEIQLMAATADDQALQADLLGHQEGGLNFAAGSGENADQ